ncbi:MAG: SGNH/GDSL hydrolase family protein, partial [Candidatus Dormibacteraeota bacterium]|nr:SGNH/GDSL hydrolase family protein [Candidatus Dormibacteraeota bacterium]
GASVFDALRWPYPGDQQVIVVHLITNDFLYGTSLVRYQQALRQVLVDLRERSPEANLICLGTWQRPGMVNRARVPLQSFDAAAREGCASEHGEFVPLDRIFATPGSRGPAGQDTPWGPTDGFHPNDVGAQMIANAVLAEIPNGN